MNAKWLWMLRNAIFKNNSQEMKYQNIKKSLQVLLILYEEKSKLRIKINVCSILAFIQKHPLKHGLHNRCS